MSRFPVEDEFDPSQPKPQLAAPAPAADLATVDADVTWPLISSVDNASMWWLWVKLAVPSADEDGTEWTHCTYCAPTEQFPTLSHLQEHRNTLAQGELIVHSRICERRTRDEVSHGDYRVLEDRPHRIRRKPGTATTE